MCTGLDIFSFVLGLDMARPALVTGTWGVRRGLEEALTISPTPYNNDNNNNDNNNIIIMSKDKAYFLNPM